MEHLKDYGLSSQEQEIIIKSSQKFAEMVEQSNGDHFGMAGHLSEVERWARFVLSQYSDLHPFVFFLSVWLHDIGFILQNDIDHAVNSELVTRQFLTQEHVDHEVIDQVCHCVRSHRCKDVLPSTVDAKMIACIDSASHFTDKKFYFMYMQTFGIDVFESKIERDFRDIQLFPKIHQQVEPLYKAWKELIKQMKDFKF